MLNFPPSPRQRELLSFIRDQGSATRTEIQLATGLSASRVSRLTAELIEAGLVDIEDRLSGAEGRPQEILGLAAGRTYLVGLDVGGLKQEIAVTDLRGGMVNVHTTRTDLTGPRTAILDSLRSLVFDSLGRAGVAPSCVLGVGVGLRAIVDPESGVISAGPEAPGWSPTWSNFPIRDELRALLPWNTIVVDDIVRARAIAERRHGSAVGIDDFAFVFADSGIGAALMINGKPYIGSGHLAGEIGHVTIEPGGPLCGCGKRGCIEAFASSSAMLARLRRTLNDPGLELDDLIASGDRGCEPHHGILHDGGAVLGRGLAILFNLLSPQQVVVGGAATESLVYRQTAEQVAREETVGQVREHVKIVQSAGHPHAGALGACSMVLDAVLLPSS